MAQDKALLGENPNATVNAQTDMSWNDDLERQFQASMPKAQQPKPEYDATLGDMAKSVGVGALGMVSGLGELSEQMTGYGAGLRDLAQSGSDALTESMTDGGRAALSAELVSENANGNLGIGDGAGDIDVWAMKFAQGIGSLAGGMLPGGAAGSVTRMVASSMLKRGASAAVAEATAARTVALLGETASTGTLVAASHGSAMNDGRQQVLDMDAGWLADNSEYFQDSLRRISTDPNNGTLSPTEMVNLAKEETANYVSKTIAGDPATIAASIAGAYGDKLLFGAVAGKASKGILKGAGKGALTEASTEAMENAGQTYGQNVSINEVAGTNRNPWEGAVKNAIEGAAIGGLTGGALGSVGGIRGKSPEQTDDLSSTDNLEQPEQDPVAQQEMAQAQPVEPEPFSPTGKNAQPNLDTPAYERQPQPEPVRGAEQIDQSNMDLPAYQRQGKAIDTNLPENTPTSDLNQQRQASRQALIDKGVLSQPLPSQDTVDLARAYDPERAAQIEQELSDPSIDDNPDYANQLEAEYQALADQARELEVDPVSTNISNRLAANQREMAQRQEDIKAPQTMQEALIQSQQSEPQVPNTEPKQAKNEPATMQSVLDNSIQQRRDDYNQIRERVKANLLPEDQGKEDLVDRLAQIEYDYKYNDKPVEKAQQHQPEPYQDKGQPFSRERAQGEINARAQQAQEADLQRQAEQERAARPEQPEANPNWQGELNGQPVTRTYMRDQDNQKAQQQSQTTSVKQAIRDRLGNNTDGRFQQFNQDAQRIEDGRPTHSQVDELKTQAKERSLERTFGGKTIVNGMSKRLRRKIQRAKGFDTETVLNEFRNNEKRLQAYQEEARRQAEREANNPENMARRKSAQALFEEKLNSPEAQQFRENLITDSMKRVNQTLDTSAGTVLEMDGQQTSLPEVKKQLATNLKNLAHKFIGKIAVMNEALRAKRAANEESQSNTSQATAKQVVGSDVNTQIAEAAQVTNTQPTEAQKEAGNYKKGVVDIQGLKVAIENPAGSERNGTDKNGKPWSVKMKNHYGYVKGTNGADGDQVDVFIGPNPDNEKVFVIDQVDPDTGAFDEHKVMIGFDDAYQASKAYSSNYAKGWGGLGHITDMTMPEFKEWLNSANTDKPLNKSVPAQKESPVTDTATPAKQDVEAQPANNKSIVDRAKDAIKQVIKNNANGDSTAKPKLKGVRSAYRDAGFTAAELQTELNKSDTPMTINEFERQQKQAYIDGKVPAAEVTQEVIEPVQEVASNSKPRKGKVGMMLGDGEVVLTVTGRETTPFPTKTKNGVTSGYLKKVDKWLIDNAILEAESRGDKFNLNQFKAINLSNMSVADKDHAEAYLFQFEPQGTKSIFKDLINPQSNTDGLKSNQDNNKKEDAQIAEKAVNEIIAKPTKPLDEQQQNEVSENIKLLDAMKGRIKGGFSPKDNNALKRAGKEIFNLPGVSDVTPLMLKKLQEAFETAKISQRRFKVNKILSSLNSPSSIKNVYDMLVKDYQEQPNLNVRTANSSDMQAYSTPAPISFLGNIVAGIDAHTTVLEPTAGNGLLLMTSQPNNTFANELDPIRAESLAWTGFDVTTLDATGNPLTNGMLTDRVDRVITNPPFGKLRDKDGKPRKFSFEDSLGNKVSLGELDHVIARNALYSMKPDGKAYLILGTSMEVGDLSVNHRVFLNWLHQNYNVTDYTEIDGKLYEKQGASWPIMLIAINGKATEPTGKFAPVKSQITRHSTWESLYDHYQEKGLLDTKSSRYERAVQSAANVLGGRKPAALIQSNDEQVKSGASIHNQGSNQRGQTGSESINGSSDGNGPKRSQRIVEQNNGNGSNRDGREVRRPGAVPTENINADTERNKTNAKPNGNGKFVESLSGDEIKTSPIKNRANQFQSIYHSKSKGFNEGVLTPANMDYYTSKALSDLEERHGNIDDYVMMQLGYKSKSDLNKAFMGLQTDAVGLAVSAIENGKAIIIGDQTGVGKGRQAAGIIRYAMKQGKTPIFITQKPNLFTDMVDDLSDIGVNNFKPMIMNSDVGIKKVTNQGSENEKETVLHKNSAKSLREMFSHINSTGELPNGIDALFLTYDQISSDQTGVKKAVLNSLAKNSVLIMDEAHTAASGKAAKSKRGEFFGEYVKQVYGLTYLSATYAKRPENMGLYMRTDLGIAAGGKDVTDAIETGGLGMQNYLAAKLAEAGHYIRRERSFDGIEIKDEIIKAGGSVEKAFDTTTEALRGLQNLSSAWDEYVQEYLADTIAIEHGLDTRTGGNKADKNINVNSFSSVVHNYISQLTLGLKADSIADLAISSIDRGEKPVVALESTLGSALKQYMEDNGLSYGDSLGSLSYSDYLMRTLDNVLAYNVKAPGESKSDKVIVPIDTVDSPIVQEMYRQAQKAIQKIGKYDIPASPIDHIRNRIEKAGYTVAEITGRDTMVDYDSRTIVKRPIKELKDRRGSVDSFNAGNLDVIILNQAGSTGLSIHSRSDYADTRQRFMIVAQPSLDINTYMQMLGRVNRTGQINVPKYANAWLDLPSEKRPAAVLAGKMASLNANTSGSTESATSVKAFDLLNKYGDEVVVQYVQDNYSHLSEYSDKFKGISTQESPANYFLGKLAVLPVDVQRNVLSDLDALYEEKINYLNATGQNDLDMMELDLQAEPIEQRVLVDGDAKRGVFSEPVYLTKVKAKARGKAPEWAEVQEELGKSSSSNFKELADSVEQQAIAFHDALQSKVNDLEAKIEDLRSKGKDTGKAIAKKADAQEVLSAYKSSIGDYKRWLSNAYGQYVNVNLQSDNAEDKQMQGVIVGVSHDSKSGDPLAASKTKIKVMVADRARQIGFTYKHVNDGTLTNAGYYTNSEQMEMVFNRQAALPNMENRYVMTGNLIMAKDQTVKNGNIIPFTTHDGRVIQGMLLPNSFEPDAHIKPNVDANAKESLDWLTSTNRSDLASLGLATPDGDAVLRRRDGYNGTAYVIELPKSVSKGKRYWGNPAVENIIGEQAVSGGGTFFVNVDESDLSDLVSAFDDIDSPLRIRHKEQARDYIRKNDMDTPTASTKNIIFSRESITNDKPTKGMSLKEAKLAADQWLKDYNGGAGVDIEVVKTQAEAEKMLGMDFGDAIAHAMYDTQSGKVIVVADNIANPKMMRKKLRHEILVHHGLKAVTGDSEYQRILERVYRGKNSPFLKDIWSKVNRNYGQSSVLDQVEEVLAHAAESERNIVQQWLDGIVEMIAHALRRVGLMKPSDVTKAELNNIVKTLADRTKRVKHWSRNSSSNNNKTTVKFSRTNQMTIEEALDMDTPKQRFNGVLNALSYAVKKVMESKLGGAIKGDIGLGAVTLRQLAEMAKDKLPQLSQYVDTVHRMLTARNQLAFDAHEMADGIRKWSAKNRKHADEMFDIAHLATVEGVDPDLDFAEAEAAILKRYQQVLDDKTPRDPSKTIQEMITHIEKVNEGSHKTNEQMKQLKELRNLLQDEPNRKLKHAELKRRFDALPKEAKDHYRAMRDKYKERHNLYKKLLIDQITNAEIDGRIKKARIADVKAQFELQEVMAPYFPLSRFGDYWISTTDNNGEKRFMMYESEREQQAAKKKLESQGYDVFSGYKLDKNPGIEGASLGFVTDLMSKVEEAKINDIKKAELKDTIYQMYLQALPSRSMRKQFMHRNKVKGWSNDALRALAENMVKGSYQLARLQYADELTKLAQETQKVAGASGDNQSSRYANELLKRHEWVMNPKHSSVAQKITSLGFLYMLGFSPAAAAINVSQNFVVALPMIGSKFGFAAASKEMAKATQDFIAAKGSIKDKLTNLDEIAAFSQWYDSGLLDSTNAHDLAGMAEGQNWKYNPAFEKASGLMSHLFHKAEVFNRETTALSAYRLARKNGMGHEQATKYAEDLTWKAHFDYTNVNRARYMQSPVMKVATQFKQYSQNMTYYLMRNAYQAMKGMNAEEKAEARKQLVGTLGMTALFGGISALPLSMIYGLANGMNAAFGDDDKPWDAETEFKTYLADIFGGDVADKIIYGAGGAGVSPRISLDGMWIRDPNRDMEGEDTWSFYAQQVAGPVLGGVLLQAIKSGDKILDGDYYRGVEGVLPKVFKDAMKAYRYSDEGALNSRGDAYREADDFSFLDLGLQSMGLTPGELSKQYQVNNARKEYEQHVLERRSSLMKAYYLAWKQKDGVMMEETQKKIAKFNRSYPKLALTSKSIRQSIKTRQRYSQQSSSGVNLNKNLRNFENEVVW